MNSDSHVNKFFIIQMITLNLILLGLIVKELITLTEIRKTEQFINSNQSLANKTINKDNLELLNMKYQKIKSKISSQNSLGDLINFIETKTEQYNLSIKESKVIYATDTEINYDITVEGNMQSISSFIYDLEEDKSNKEISSSTLKFTNSLPNLKISIINKKL